MRQQFFFEKKNQKTFASLDAAKNTRTKLKPGGSGGNGFIPPSFPCRPG
jgi:hypothetical protein